MNIMDGLIQKFSTKNLSFGDFQLITLSLLREPLEYENYTLSLIDEHGNFFGETVISKRLITAYAQDLLVKRNVLLLPDFIEVTAIIMLSDILNKIDENFKIRLEISPFSSSVNILTTDFLLVLKYKKVFSPLILRVNTEQIYNILFKKDMQIDYDIEYPIMFSGVRHLPLYIIGALKENDLIKLPNECIVTINGCFKLSNHSLSIEEERMEENVLSIEDLRLPVSIKVELGNLRFAEIKELIKSKEVTNILQNKQCKIMLDNSLIATGEVYENQVRVTKIFI